MNYELLLEYEKYFKPSSSVHECKSLQILQLRMFIKHILLTERDTHV